MKEMLWVTLRVHLFLVGVATLSNCLFRLLLSDTHLQRIMTLWPVWPTLLWFFCILILYGLIVTPLILLLLQPTRKRKCLYTWFIIAGVVMTGVAFLERGFTYQRIQNSQEFDHAFGEAFSQALDATPSSSESTQ